MVFRGIAARRSTPFRRVLPLVMGSCLIAGCIEEPRPRSYLEFMEDPIAREGTLARCNQDRDATADDPECTNARRAASTAAARAEGDGSFNNRRTPAMSTSAHTRPMQLESGRPGSPQPGVT